MDLRAGARHARSRYRSLEGLLRAVERRLPRFWPGDAHLKRHVRPTGADPAGPREQRTSRRRASRLSFQRYLGRDADFTAIFMTPKRTRVAVPRLVRSGVRRMGLTARPVHFAVPLPRRSRPDENPNGAHLPARMARGRREAAISHPVMTALQSRFLDAQAVESAVSRLIPAGGARGEGAVVRQPRRSSTTSPRSCSTPAGR